MKHSGLLLTTSLLTGLLGAGLDAQITSKPNQVVGWVYVTQSTRNIGELHLLDMDKGCGATRTLCTKIGSLSTSPLLGGTAYDARNESVWVASSSLIERIDLKTCTVGCWLGPKMIGSGVLTGLAISTRHSRMWHLESAAGYLGIQEYDISTCKPTPLTGCKLSLKSTETSCAITYDEDNDVLIYVITAKGNPPKNRLVIASPSNPCKQICSIDVPNCPTPQRAFYDVTGMAYDSCTKTLHLTDGTSMKQANFTDLLNCKATFTPCCLKGGTATFRSLALIPGWVVKSMGNGCSTATCTRCLRLTLSTMGGDPAIGNPSFGFQLDYAPSNSLGILFLGGGACTPGIKLGFLCVPFYPLVTSLLMSPAIQVSGGGTCASTAKYPLPIPVMTALCNQKFCAQVLTLCPNSTGLGWGGTNALEFNVTN